MRKTETPGYFMDGSGHVVINTNDKDLQTYRSQVKQDSEMKDLRDEIEALKSLLTKLSKE